MAALPPEEPKLSGLVEPRHENPLTVFMHGRDVMALPVFDYELSNIQSSTVIGAVTFGLGALTFGTFVNYSIALQASGLTMDVQTRAIYSAIAFACVFLTILFAVVTIWEAVKLNRQFRAIRQTDSKFVWSDAEGWVRVKTQTDSSSASPASSG